MKVHSLDPGICLRCHEYTYERKPHWDGYHCNDYCFNMRVHGTPEAPRQHNLINLMLRLLATTATASVKLPGKAVRFAAAHFPHPHKREQQYGGNVPSDAPHTHEQYR